MEWTNSVQGDESHIYFESYFPPRISLQTPWGREPWLWLSIAWEK